MHTPGIIRIPESAEAKIQMSYILEGADRREFREIVLEAFDRATLVRAMAGLSPSRIFDNYVSPGSFKNQVFDLIGAAAREGWLDQIESILFTSVPGRTDLIARMQAITSRITCDNSTLSRPSPPSPELSVERIDGFDTHKSRIREAMDLLEDLIPEAERYPRDTMVTLIRRHLSGEFGPDWKFYFLVAMSAGRCAGMLICYEDIAANYCFISYLAARNPRRPGQPSVSEELANGLLRVRAERGLPQPRFLFEVDDPRRAADPRQRMRRMGRLEVFEDLAPFEGLHVRVLDIPFLQPALDWPASAEKSDLLLCLAAPGIQSFLDKSAVAQILDWSYLQLYGEDIYEDDSTRAEYGRHIRELRDSIVSKLPDRVRLLRSRDLIPDPKFGPPVAAIPASGVKLIYSSNPRPAMPLVQKDRTLLKEALCATPNFIEPVGRLFFIRTQLEESPFIESLTRTFNWIRWAGDSATVADEVLHRIETQEFDHGVPALALIARALQYSAGPQYSDRILDLRRRMKWDSLAPTEQEQQSASPSASVDTIDINLCMAAIPTAIVHLFGAKEHPLVRFAVHNHGRQPKRYRVFASVQGYSAEAIDTIEVAPQSQQTIHLLPTFFPKETAPVTELTRASVRTQVEDLSTDQKTERTFPVWLLARNSAPIAIEDPSTKKWIDMTRYLGAFVTPNAAAVMEFLPAVVARHPDKRLVGYQIDETEVALQVQAVFEALKQSGTKYVNSVIEFTPEPGSANQRVRLPRESLHNTNANCIDGTVLFASLLEAISLHPAIVIIPGHAFVAWETFRDSGAWRYLETTMISTHSFADACAKGDERASKYQAEETVTPGSFKRFPLRELRDKGITPLE